MLIKKCIHCNATLKKTWQEMINDAFSRRNPFFCQECINNIAWRKNHNGPLPAQHQNNLICDVSPVNPHINSFLKNIMDNEDLLCEIQFRNGAKRLVFPYFFEKDFVYAYGDRWFKGAVDTVHAPNSEHLRFPLCDIKKMEQVSIYQDYYASDRDEPMIGFKAMPVVDGKIADGYELGVMMEVPKQSDPRTDYKACYLHYCEKLEEPIFHWDRDYIADAVLHPDISPQILFRTKAEGHYLQDDDYAWGSNKLTITEVVSRQEIIDYYEQRPELIEELRNYWKKNNNPVDLWERYKQLAV